MLQIDCNRQQNPLVVVVTVCRNDLSGLKMVVESVRSNHYVPLWHIIIDGSSTDGTAIYLRQNSSLFAYTVSEPDYGIYDAMNKAIDQCPTDAWVIFLNAGDRFYSDQVLTNLMPLLVANSDFIFGDVEIRGANANRRYHTRRHPFIEMPGCHQGTLIRSELLKRLKLDPNYKVGADFDFFLRAIKGGAGKMKFFEGVIAQIAPEGYSARNEIILQQDYFRSISLHVGRRIAYGWLIRRVLRGFLRKLLIGIVR